MELFIKYKIWSLILVIAFCLASCSSDDEPIEEMNLSTAGLSLLATPRSGPIGFGQTDLFCFSINYPISVILPDGSLQEFNSEEELQSFIEVWLEDNDVDLEQQPNLVYPVSVETEDGTQELNNDDDFISLIEDCFGGLFECLQSVDVDNIQNLCFNVIFPIEVVCADGSVEAISGLDQETVCGINGIDDLADFDLELVYPIEIEQPDGSISIINSDEELQVHLLACFEEVFGDCG
jgi:hypothetical protein